jgi:hypothetical protein
MFPIAMNEERTGNASHLEEESNYLATGVTGSFSPVAWKDVPSMVKSISI